MKKKLLLFLLFLISFIISFIRFVSSQGTCSCTNYYGVCLLGTNNCDTCFAPRCSDQGCSCSCFSDSSRNGVVCSGAHCPSDNCNYRDNEMIIYNPINQDSSCSGICTNGNCVCSNINQECRPSILICNVTTECSDGNEQGGYQCGSGYYKCRYDLGKFVPHYSWENTNNLNTEYPGGSLNWCSDNHDNDCDGRIDCLDRDCDPMPYCAATLQDVPNKNAYELQPVELIIIANNSNTHTLNLSYSSNPIITEPIIYLIGSPYPRITRWRLSWTPNQTSGGNNFIDYNFFYTMTDLNSNTQDTKNNTIRVYNINKAPEIIEPNNDEEFFITLPETIKLNVSGRDQDRDYDIEGTLTLTITHNLPLNIPTISRIDNQDKWEFSWSSIGVTPNTKYFVNFLLSDSYGATDNITISINVTTTQTLIPMICGLTGANPPNNISCYWIPDYPNNRPNQWCYNPNACVYDDDNSQSPAPICNQPYTVLENIDEHRIICSNSNTWCPEGYFYLDSLGACVYQQEECNPNPCNFDPLTLEWFAHSECFLPLPPSTPNRACCLGISWPENKYVWKDIIVY
ncbi:MAG: hypothetical protein QXG00_01015 [Candidatus Woesearchaeota archaeon]